MNIREYEAPTLRDGLLQVREELGPDAVILETQKLRRGGVMGIGARDAVRNHGSTSGVFELDAFIVIEQLSQHVENIAKKRRIHGNFRLCFYLRRQRI